MSALGGRGSGISASSRLLVYYIVSSRTDHALKKKKDAAWTDMFEHNCAQSYTHICNPSIPAAIYKGKTGKLPRSYRGVHSSYGGLTVSQAALEL